jgi:hypothetical protein
MSVYFVATECRRFVKIGRTRNLERRLRSLRSSSPVPLVMLKVLPGHHRTEQVYHDTFHVNRLNGEWFAADAGMLAFIDQLAPEWRDGDVDA